MTGSTATANEDVQKNTSTPMLKRLNFKSSLNDELVERTFGKAVRQEARQLLDSKDFQLKLNRLFQTGDVQSDRLAKKLRDPKIKADFELATSKGIDAVDDPCEELVAFMDHAVTMPSMLDRELVELGAEVFLTRFNPLTFFAYGAPCAGLQGASAGIAAAAWLTNQPEERMTLKDNIQRDDVYQRLLVRFMETFRWFSEVAQPGATEPYSSSFQANLRVRIIHSHIRNNLKVNAADWNYTPPLGWDTDQLGSPLSAAEGSIVVTTLATAIVVAKRELNLQVSQREIDALFQFTSYLNYMQGVPEELLFANAHDTTVYFSAYLMSMDPYCYKDSVDALYYGIQRFHLEKALFPESVLLQKLMDGLLQASWQEVYGPSHQEFYNTSKPGFSTKMGFKAIKLCVKGVNTLSKHSPFLKRKLDDTGRQLWNELFPQAEEKIKQHFKAVTDGVDIAKA